MYKKASEIKLRFATNVGPLSVEQLWDLSLAQLSNLVKGVKKVLKKDDDDELSFLDDQSKVNTVDQLRFDILKDVYLTKKKQDEEARNAIDVKAHNQKILQLISEKTDESLKGKSIEELEALLK